MRRQRYLDIAADLETKIRANRTFALQSISELTETYHVAYHTMWKAMQVLIAKGVLSTAPGKKIVVSSNLQPGSEKSQATSTDALYAAVRTRIESGDYKVGKPLPKVDYFVVSEGISHRTVTRALRRLASQSLVHRVKRRWIAGPKPPQVSTSALVPKASDAPVVLVIYHDESDWSAVLGHSFVNAFLTPCITELFNHRILIEPCFRQAQSDMHVAVPTGIDAIVARAKGLGSRYLGALTMSIFPKEELLGEHLVRLLSLGKPVLYFDSAERGAHLTRQSLSARKNYYRLHQDEASAVGLVLNALVQNGHRIVGMPSTAYGGWWAQRRTAAVERMAAKLSQQMRIITTMSDEDLWGFDKLRSLHEFTTTIATQAGIREPIGDGEGAPFRRFRRLLLTETPSLSSLLKDHAPTAIIGLNDRMAREYYFWLRALGLQIPRDMSLISFDNSPESTFFPISTVDWGFERLGYLAAHILIRDVQVQADRQGNIPGTCRIADRGSVGERGNSADLVRLLRG